MGKGRSGLATGFAPCENLHEMAATAVRKAKKSIKQDQIVQLIRNWILDGKYLPGAQIPIQTELVRRLGVSSVTIQRALSELHQQGFLTAKRRMGTFVAQELPHLNRYALVFPKDPREAPFWSHLYEGLELEARRINTQGEKRIRSYYGWEMFERSADFLKLQEEIRTHLVGGLIFPGPPHSLLGSFALKEPRVPKVAISSDKYAFDFPLLTFDHHAWTTMALEYLAQHRVKRIALVCTDAETRHRWLTQRDALAKFGVFTLPRWAFIVPADVPSTATGIVQLWMDLPPEARPEAILVTDDHLIHPVVAGLNTCADPAARQTRVVSACNFPDQHPVDFPVVRLGYFLPEVLALCMDLIDAQRLRKKVPAITVIKPEFAPGTA